MDPRPPEDRARPAPLPVYCNPSAGLGGQPDTGPLDRALGAAGVRAELHSVPPAELARAVEGAVERGAGMVGVSGGDGTLLTAAGVLAGTGTALAPFPTGTLNHFARRLGLHDLAAAADAVARGATIPVPVGVVDDRVFLNTATFGLYADVVRRRDRLRRRLRKWPAALVAWLQTLPRFRPITVTVEMDGKQLTCETPLVWVGVGAGSFPRVHEADDRRAPPELEIVVVRPGSRLAALALVLRIAVQLRDQSRLRDDPRLLFLHGRRLLIHADHHVGVTLDGEVLRADPPIFVGLQPDALSVSSPPPAG